MNLPPKQHEHTAAYFFLHFLRNLVIGFIILAIILGVGTIGYHHFEKTDWLDSYVNASMIVSGVGTLNDPHTRDGKIFVSIYSLIGGGGFILILAIIFSPIFHWLFRQLKVEDREHFKD